MGDLFQPIPLLCIGRYDEPTRGSRALSLSSLSAVRRDRRGAGCSDPTLARLRIRSLLGGRRQSARCFCWFCPHAVLGDCPAQAYGKKATALKRNVCSRAGHEYTKIDSGYYSPREYIRANDRCKEIKN